jgi:hypothetical protein
MHARHSALLTIAARRQIMSMANMKDGERLELLKEIGGTKVSKARRQASRHPGRVATRHGSLRDRGGAQSKRLNPEASWPFCALA